MYRLFMVMWLVWLDNRNIMVCVMLFGVVSLCSGMLVLYVLGLLLIMVWVLFLLVYMLVCIGVRVELGVMML